MNYERIYNQIIERSKNELEQRIEHKKNGGYYEGHHIIPRCMGERVDQINGTLKINTQI